VVGLAGWPVIRTGRPAGDGGRDRSGRGRHTLPYQPSMEQTLSGTGARLHCTQELAGRGDEYQCGLDWGRSIFRKINNDVLLFVVTARELLPRVGSEVIRIGPAPFPGRKS